MAIKLFLDSAEIELMKKTYAAGEVQGYTTNPSLMRKAGVSDYEKYARQVIEAIPDRPLSFEIFSDDFETMEKEARKIASWGGQVYVKIPVTNTKAESACPLIRRLADDGIPLNVTALMTLAQVEAVAGALNRAVPSLVSVFAGRIADTGVDPKPFVSQSAEVLADHPRAELLWASTREVFNIREAELTGCRIITVPYDIVKKLGGWGKDLTENSLDTVKGFYADACAAGYKLV